MATVTDIPSSIIHDPVGDLQPNLAPLAPAQKAAVGAKPEEVKLHEYLKKSFSTLSKERDDVWREIYSACHLVALFVRGKQMLRKSTYGNGWRFYAPLSDTGVDDIRAINLTRFYADNIVVKWVQSSSDLQVHATKDTDEAILAARAADILIEHYENEWYTPTFRQREARLALITGTYVRRIYYDSDGHGKARRPLFEDVTLGGGGGVACPSCGWAGSPDEAMNGQCPQCDQPVESEAVPEMQAKSLTGVEEYDTGSLRCESVPLWNLRYDLSEPLETSPWLIYQRRVRKDIIRSKVQGQVKVERGKASEPGLDALQAMQFSGPAIGGKTTSGIVSKVDERDSEYTDLCEMWLTADMYGHVVLKEEVQTVSGQVIPAGPLSDSFPDGLCVMGLDGLEVILYLFNESHQDHFVAGQYHLDPISGAGDGVVDLIEIQRQFNIGNSQIFSQIRANATPAVLYDKDLITGDKAAYLGNPKMNIPVDLTRLPEQRGLSQAVHQLMPGQLPGHVIEYVHQFLNNMFQLTSHATDFGGGLPGVNNSTATGAQIGQALANSLHAPQLQMLAEVNQRTAKLTLKLFQKYCTDEQYLRLSGKNDAEQGVWLKGADIDTAVVIDVVPESWLPQSGLERRERLKEFITFFGNVDGLQAAIATSPKLVGNLIRSYDVNIDIGDWDAVLRLGRRRIEQLKKSLPVVQKMQESFDPQMLEAMGPSVNIMLANMLLNSLQPMPDIREEGHDTAAAYYRDWLTTDEGLKSPEILREAVKSLADTHLRFQLMGGPQAAAQPPIDPMTGMPMMGGGGMGGGFPQMDVGQQGQQQAAAAANMGPPQVGAMAGGQ